MTLRVEEHASAAEFLAATAVFRAAEPVRTNIIGTIAEGVAAGREYESELWCSVRSGDDVVGLAVRTHPFNTALSPMPSDAAALVGTFLAERDPLTPGINGPRRVVLEVLAAAGWAERAAVEMADVLRVLDAYVPPPSIPGAARLATDDDMDLVLAWFRQFVVDAGVPDHDIDRSARMRMAARAVLLWEVDGEPRALGGHAVPVATPAGPAGRIGPIYTPAEFRRQGYGAAVTAAVVEKLQPDCAVILLVADQANPTSNAVYERLGFVVADELLETHIDHGQGHG